MQLCFARSLPVSYLSTSSNTQTKPRQSSYLSQSESNSGTPTTSTTSMNVPVLRTYSGLSSATPQKEENWGPPVINTALLNYNIGIRHQ